MSNPSNAAALAANGKAASFNVEAVRRDFPVLEQTVYGKPLVYLDNAASAQKPRQVLDAMNAAYETYYSNVHRGLHRLSELSTDAFEAGRVKVAGFLNAGTPGEIIFTRGATEALNLVAASYGRAFLREGDEVVISHMEHHSNIVPWQLLRAEKGISLKIAPIDADGNFLMDAFEALLSEKTKLVAVTHVSNALGTITPLKEIIHRAHDHGAVVVVDGCQAVPHMAVDVQDLDADFYAFSGHKVYGPTGVGALYGKAEILEKMPPYQGGGEMISSVTFEETTFKKPPHRFEAGTPAIVEVIGLGAAVDYLSDLGMEHIFAHDADLLEYATERLNVIPGLQIHGRAREKASIVSFVLDGAHAHDVGTIVDREGVAVRAGHHCAQPVMDLFGVSSTVRASFGVYNTRAEVDALVDALGTVAEIFKL